MQPNRLSSPQRAELNGSGRNHPANARQGSTARVIPPSTKIDLPKLLWGNRWLLMLGLLAGLAGGYFQYDSSPALFRSTSKIQIVESLAKYLPIAQLDGQATSRSLSDEVMVIQSERMLRRAAEVGELGKLPQFEGMSPDNIGLALRGGLDVALFTQGGTSANVIRVQFDSTSGTASQRVVQAIVDAYAVHLQEQYRNVGQETIDLIQSARKDLLDKLSKLEEDYTNFKHSTDLIYRDNVVTSIHRDNAAAYLAKRQTLILQQAEINGILNAANKAIEDGQPTEVVLMALKGSSEDITKSLSEARDDTAGEKLQRLQTINSLSSAQRMRQERLVPLELERQTLARTFGPNHVALQSIDDRIRVVEQTIEEISQSESKSLSAIQEIWDEIDEKAANNIGQDGGTLLEDRYRLTMLALRQRLNAVEQQMAVIAEEYKIEVEAARAESSAEIRSAQLSREISRHQQLYDRIVARLDEVNLMSGGEGLRVYPLDTPKVGYQIAPSLSKSLMLGGFLGGLVAFGLGFLRQMADRSYKSAREIAEHTGQRIIGHVPVIPSHKIKKDEPGQKMDGRMCTFFEKQGSKAEAFRAIRTAIFFSLQSGENQVLQVTSPTPSDGKSTVAANLAISLAQSGKRVLICDADLRRPRVGKTFGIDNKVGLAWAIEKTAFSGTDGFDISEAICDSEIPNLSVMVAGTRPENPAELLTSGAFEKLVASLRTKFDMIIFDTPPLLAVSDPSNVVNRTDGVILVVRLRKNAKPLVAQAVSILETLHANVLGIVVNGVGSKQAGDYGKVSASDGYGNVGTAYKDGYGYSYGYTEHSEKSGYYTDDLAVK